MVNSSPDSKYVLNPSTKKVHEYICTSNLCWVRNQFFGALACFQRQQDIRHTSPFDRLGMGGEDNDDKPNK